MADEFYARADYEYNGGDTKFGIPFPYINKEHIQIIINNDTENPSTEFEFITDFQIQYTGELNSGDVVSVRRTTPLNTRMVVFTDGNILDEESQNISILQIFNKMQEITDMQNALQSSMTQFLTLKDLIEENLNLLNEAAEHAKEMNNLYSETVDLVQGIEKDYSELKDMSSKGINCKVSKNLFGIELTDKELQGLEKEGLCLQGEVCGYEDYPTAYTTILDEFTQGTKKVYTSTEDENYYHLYTGSVSGEFYIPKDTNLEIGGVVYNDTYCLEEKGHITELTTVEADEYTINENILIYVPKDTQLEQNTEVYSDKLLKNKSGVIKGLKTVRADKYTVSRSGSFYINTDSNIRVGRELFENEELTISKGYITNVEIFESDKYSLGGLDDYDEFYVPKDTILTTGTKIYSDVLCSNEIGEINSRGSASSGGTVYCYKIKTTASTKTFYINQKLQANKKYSNVYSNSSLTKHLMYYNNIKAGIETFNSAAYGAVYSFANSSYSLSDMGTISLVSTTSNTNYNYITLKGNETKLSYNKIATVQTETISINNGEREIYSLDSSVINNYIAIDDKSYQKYNKTGTVESLSIKIDEGELETLIDNGIQAQEGVAFEYVEAANGHKIADIKYKSAIGELTGFYLIDMNNNQFTLPVLDKNKKYIYFVTGNMTIVPASIQAVTKSYLNNTLENYALKDDLNNIMDPEILNVFINIVQNCDTKLNEVQNKLDTINEYLQGIEAMLLNVLGEDE